MSIILSFADVERLVQGLIPEGPGLEYKQALVLDPDEKRLETLKDLSGLGNGGGATVIYGVARDPNNAELPSGIVPLTDPVLPGRLEDIVRSGIHPPLLASYSRLAHPTAGYVLAIEITRSPLGPYMVQWRGDQRYYKRIASRTTPMTEQEVRDAYLLAARARERRQAVWEDHLLPLKPQTAAPCFCISALPEEPLVDLLHIGSVRANDVRPPDEFGTYRDYALVPNELQIWAHGLHGQTRLASGHDVRFRLYRDGAIGWAVAYPSSQPEIHTSLLARIANAQLIYMDWTWQRIGLRTLVETRLELHHIDAGHIWEQDMVGQRNEWRAQRPTDVAPPLSMVLTMEKLVGDFRHAQTRHLVVRQFLNRVYQAFGQPRASAERFTAGWLYDSNGSPTDYYIVGGGVFKGRNGEAVAGVYGDGSIYSHRTGQLVGYSADGVFLDTSGNAVAAVEMAAGSGLPDDFMAKQIMDVPITAKLGIHPQAARQPHTPSHLTKQWSGVRVTDLLPYP